MRTQGPSLGVFPTDCCTRVRFFVGRFRADDFLLAKLTRKIFSFFLGGEKGDCSLLSFRAHRQMIRRAFYGRADVFKNSLRRVGSCENLF